MAIFKKIVIVECTCLGIQVHVHVHVYFLYSKPPFKFSLHTMYILNTLYNQAVWILLHFVDVLYSIFPKLFLEHLQISKVKSY